MADERKNGRISLAIVATVVGIIGGPLAVWGDAQRRGGQVDEKVTNLEKRQTEDRHETKFSIDKVDTKVERIDGNVQVILRKLEAMEAVQRAERRDRR